MNFLTTIGAAVIATADGFFLSLDILDLFHYLGQVYAGFIFG